MLANLLKSVEHVGDGDTLRLRRLAGANALLLRCVGARHAHRARGQRDDQDPFHQASSSTFIRSCSLMILSAALCASTKVLRFDGLRSARQFRRNQFRMARAASSLWAKVRTPK